MTTNLSSKSRYGKKLCIICCCTTTILLVAVIAVLAIVLSQTVYKVKGPNMTVNSLTIGQLNLTQNSNNSNNLTITTDASIRNPNSIPFEFGVSTTWLYYHGSLMSVAYSPAGDTRAHGTYRANVTFEVASDRLLNNTSLLGELQGGTLGMETSTRVGGRVKILGLFGRHVDVMMNCTVHVTVANQEVVDQHCVHRVWL